MPRFLDCIIILQEPLAAAEAVSSVRRILAEEGFSPSDNDIRSRTVLMDLTPSLQELRDQMRPHWKRELRVAERKGLRWRGELEPLPR